MTDDENQMFYMKREGEGFPSRFSYPSDIIQDTFTLSGGLLILLIQWLETDPEEDGNLAGIVADRINEYPHEFHGKPSTRKKLLKFMQQVFTSNGYLFYTFR